MPGRGDRGGQRARQVQGRVPVMGQGGGDRGVVAGQARVTGERLAVGGVQAAPLARQHVLVDRVPGQRVPERVAAAGVVDHEQVALDGLPQPGVELGVADARHLGEQLVGHAAARDRRRPQQPLRLRAQRVHPAQQHVRQGRGKISRVAAAAHQASQLLHQVGVAAGPVEDQVDESGRGFGAEDRTELGGDLPRLEPAQLHVLHRPDPVPAGDQRSQRVTPVQLVGAVGGQQHDPDPAQRPDQERDQLPGGLVRPMQVLEDKQQRPPGAEPAQQAEDQLEELRHLNPFRGRFGRPARVEFGQEPAKTTAGRAEHLGQFVRRADPGQRTQRVDERGERQALRAELDAMAGQHRETGAGCAPGQLGDQARLADAGLARDDREARLGRRGPLQQRGQRRDLLAPPDEDRALHRLAHKVHGATAEAGEGSRGRHPGPFGIKIRAQTGWDPSAWPHATLQPPLVQARERGVAAGGDAEDVQVVVGPGENGLAGIVLAGEPAGRLGDASV